MKGSNARNNNRNPSLSDIIGTDGISIYLGDGKEEQRIIRPHGGEG
jgi:hypothetical protein